MDEEFHFYRLDTERFFVVISEDSFNTIIACVINQIIDVVYAHILYIYIYIYIQGMSSLRSLTPFTPTCNTRLTKN